MYKGMDASRHPTKGLCTPKMEPIHKINYIKRRITKVPSIPKKKILGKNIFDSLKGVSSPSKTLLFLSHQIAQKIACGINKTLLSLTFPPSAPSQAKR